MSIDVSGKARAVYSRKRHKGLDRSDQFRRMAHSDTPHSGVPSTRLWTNQYKRRRRGFFSKVIG
jgi:hypothetical protein